MEHTKSNPEREAYSITGLPQEQENYQINNLTLHLNEIEKQQ